MNKIPTSNTELLIWILVIVVGLIFGALLFFVKRYINENDTNHKKIDTNFKELKEDFKETVAKFEASAKEIKTTADMFKTASLTFQMEIHKELHEAKKATAEIIADSKYVNRTVADLQSVVMKHQESLSMGAVALTKQREEITEIKTVIKKLGGDKILVTQKKENQ